MATNPDSSDNVHRLALSGYGAGNSESYDKARPSYPPDVLSAIRKAVAKNDGLKIVEMGCGTGIFTRALLEHPEWATSVAEMRCSDPTDGMRTVFAQTTKDTRVTISPGTFDKTDVPDKWADVIFAATAFHWCTDLEEAMIELERISAPGSTMCFLWNTIDREIPWTKQIWQIWDPYLGDAGGSEKRLGHWRRLFTLPLYASHFAPPEDSVIRYAYPTTREGITAYVLSASGVAAQPADEKAKIAKQVEGVIDKGEGLVWIDKEKGVFEQPLATSVVIMRRKA